jgi:prevent-host-death family protein
MRSYSAKDAKNELGKLLDEAQASPVMIHKHGRAFAVVMSAAQFAADRDIWDGVNRELFAARQYAEKLAYEVQSLNSLVAKLEADNSWHRDLVEKLRHFMPPGADAFLLDGDEEKFFSFDKSGASFKPVAAESEQATSLPTFATTQPTPDEKPPLTGHDLATPEGRREFLITFYEFHQEAGLLMAVNYVWGCLKRPKAVFCQQMAYRLGLGGQGKTALRYVLQKFLQESLYDWQVPDWPQQEDFPDFDSFHAETLRYHERLDREFGQIIDRWEAILDGRDPNQPEKKSAEIIKGPWRAQTATRLSDKKERQQ